MDSCSDASYVNLDVVLHLGVPLGQRLTTQVQQLTSTTPLPVWEVVVSVLGRSGRPVEIECLTMKQLPINIGNAPLPDIVKNLLPGGKEYADPDLFINQRRQIKLLVGLNAYHELVYVNGHRRLSEGLILLKLVFGWITKWRGPYRRHIYATCWLFIFY